MIYHHVWLPFQPSLSPEQITQVMNSLKKLQQAIPQIQSYTDFLNISKERFAEGYTHGFTMTFLTEQDLNIYLEHPVHVKVAKENIIPALAKDPVVFDYKAK